MGFVNTEQTTAIIESVAKVVEASQPVSNVSPEPSYMMPIVVSIVGAVATGLTGFFLDRWAKREETLWRKKK